MCGIHLNFLLFWNNKSIINHAVIVILWLWVIIINSTTTRKKMSIFFMAPWNFYFVGLVTFFCKFILLDIRVACLTKFAYFSVAIPAWNWYVCRRFLSRLVTIKKLILKQPHHLLNSTHMWVESKSTAKKCFFGKLYDRFSGLFDQTWNLL